MIRMSEAVTVPSLMMVTSRGSIVSEELLARDMHTHTHRLAGVIYVKFYKVAYDFANKNENSRSSYITC